MAQKIALLIGSGEYQYPQDLKPLITAVRNLAVLEKLLKNPELGGFDEVVSLPHPKAPDMMRAIATLFTPERSKDDLILFYFAGHGVKDDAGRLYFATNETQTNLLSATAVQGQWVLQRMDECRAKKQVVILDCCYSGAFDPNSTAMGDQSVDLRQVVGATGSDGRVALASSSSMEYSFEREGLDLSIYTRYLVEGIQTGAGDRNEDGFISTGELHDYVAERIREVEPRMKPKIIVLKDEGYNVILAKVKLTDPCLLYRKILQKYAPYGIIRPASRGMLAARQKRLCLSLELVQKIEAEYLLPFVEHRENLEHYQETLIAEIKYQFPLDQEAQDILRDLQLDLGLEDLEVQDMYQQVVKKLVSESQLSSANIKNDSNPHVIKEFESYEEQLAENISLSMVAIPAGSYLMGSPESEKNRFSDESPQHEVKIEAFYMGKYQVTQAQWQAIMGSNPSSFKKGGDYLVERVSWNDCQEFIEKLNQKTGKKYRLPSEAEWEYACRAGTKTAYSFGDDESLLGEYAWYGDNSGGSTYPVGQKKPNEFGLYDMHGNVWEWCEDDYVDNYNTPRTQQPCKNATTQNSAKALRGGSWNGNAGNCRSANRNWYDADYRSIYFGFRAVFS